MEASPPPELHGVRPLWVHAWYDGPLAGVAEYGGRLCWFAIAPSRDGERDRFLLFQLSDEEIARERRRHELFRRHVSAYWDVDPDGRLMRGPFQAPAEQAAYWESTLAGDRPEYRDNRVLGWFRLDRPMEGHDGIALGAYVRGYPSDSTAMDRYAQLVGRWPALIHVFRNWTDATRDFDAHLADSVTMSGAALMISWQPPAASIAAIAEGTHDGYVREYARAVRAWSDHLLLRFGHEMNGEWIPWLAEPDAYRSAWRRVHAIFSEEGADTVAWVWSPHVLDARATHFAPFFPGEDVVDWVALDGYNWGRSQASSRWQTFDEIFADAYRDLAALAPGKPIMLAEIGCTDEGGDKAAWLREAFMDAIPARFPAVRAVAWFHANPRGHADWRVDSSPAALDAWRDVVSEPYYGGVMG